MAYIQTDDELVKILDSTVQVLSVLNLPNSQNLLDSLTTYIKNTVPNLLDAVKINTEFRKLQIDSATEFSTTSHRTNVLKLLNAAMRVTIAQNQTEMRNVLNEPNVIEINTQRIEAFKILKKLEKIIQKGSTNEEEKIIGLSYYYLSIIDGIYRNSLRACYVWQQLARKDVINKSTIHESSIHEISKYFQSNQIDMSYFEGWHKVIRNAVGHSTFEYDSSTKKAIYRDLIAKTTEQLSLTELTELIEKLFDVFFAILLLNQILRVNDVCQTLISRYP